MVIKCPNCNARLSEFRLRKVFLCSNCAVELRSNIKNVRLFCIILAGLLSAIIYIVFQDVFLTAFKTNDPLFYVKIAAFPISILFYFIARLTGLVYVKKIKKMK